MPISDETARDLDRVFKVLSDSQADWQDQIGFGEEGAVRRHAVEATSGLNDETTNLRIHAVADLRNYYMTKLGLIMTEAAEAFDEMRLHDIGERYYSTDNLGKNKPEGVLSELADVIIRIWSLMGETKLSEQLVDAIVEKITYNESRAHKHGGKAI